MDFKEMMYRNMEKYPGDLPGAKEAYEHLMYELEQLTPDKKKVMELECLIETCCTCAEERGYSIGFDSAVTLLTGARSLADSMKEK